MRPRTALGVGAVFAGSLVLGTGGTVALLSDTASLSAEVGAGSLSLAVAEPPGPVQLHLDRAADLAVRAEIGEGSQAALRVSLVGAQGADPCAGLPTADLTIDVHDGSRPAVSDLCSLVTTPLPLVVLDAEAATADLSLTVTAPPPAAGPKGSVQWTGVLRLDLVQTTGGFSDAADVPVHVVVPPGQVGRGTPGNDGNGAKDRTAAGSGTAAGPPQAPAAAEATPAG